MVQIGLYEATLKMFFKRRNPVQERLFRMKQQTLERENSEHADFLNQFEDNHRNHIKQTEHHGAQYWQYYYSGESPIAILRNQPVMEHSFGTVEENQAIKEHMLSSAFVNSNYGLDEAESKRKWLAEMYLAESAFKQQDQKEAAVHLRNALEKTRSWEHVDECTYKTLVLYAAAMSALGKFDQAQELHQRATDVFTQIQRERKLIVK